MKRHSLFPDSRVIHIKKLRPQIFQTSGPYLHCLSSLPVAMHAIMSLVLCGVSLLVASAAASSSLRRESRLKDYESIALNSNLKFSERPQATEILADQSEAVVGAYYPSGWWMGEVTQSGGCDHDDLLGDNQVVNFEGYALNVCLFQGGNRMMYQCDGESIIQEIYADYNCTHKTTSYFYQAVGCNNNVIYNCSDSDTIPIPAGESFVVQNYYAVSYDVDNCTGQVQFFVAQENEHCFATAGGSQYNDYPYLREYSASDSCSGDTFTINTAVTTCTPDESNTENGISYTHFNTTLMVGKPVIRPIDDGGDSSSDDFFDDEGALIGVIVGGAVFLLLCCAAVYYFFFAKGSESLLGAAGSTA